MEGRIGFVGAGAMAEAIMCGLVRQQVVSPSQIVATDPLPERRALVASRYHVQTVVGDAAAAQGTEMVILAVKPQHMSEALAELRGQLSAHQLIISVAAGVTIQAIAETVHHDRIVRVMPNTPAQIGAGMSVWTATAAVSENQRLAVTQILRSLGKEAYVEDERLLDMATAVSGSGPGYVFLMIEAFIDAAVHVGLSRALAAELVLQTVLGSTQMVRETGKHPAELRNLVTSPAGTTAAGLAALEAGGVRTAIDRAVVVAYERSRVLGS